MKKQFLLLFITVIGFGLTFGQDGPNLEEGESLYRQNCASCHYVDKVLIGPALGEAKAKYANDKEWLYAWVKNAQGMVNSGDAKAVALFEQYNKQLMTAFPTLQNEQIDNILAWAEAEANKEPEVAAVSVQPTDPWADPSVYYVLLGMVGLLALISVVLIAMTAVMVTAVRAKDGHEPFTWAEAKTNALAMLQNKFVISAVLIIALTGGATSTIIGARKIGLHQGYMPEQPIKFSHKLHAGEYQIECEYCHSGVRKSKNAWIPSTNVCMNCHKGIQEGPKYGEEEIAKILTSYEADEAIEWVRIHNLPDHAYFNHAQHVVVGGLECQTCHGPVQEMEVVYQYSDLGMGWCIDCHRQEKVKVLGDETDMTVEDMGGLECQRCHY